MLHNSHSFGDTKMQIDVIFLVIGMLSTALIFPSLVVPNILVTIALVLDDELFF
jgi:NhaP-type Na+/H+ and K+/H+ antiporter